MIKKRFNKINSSIKKKLLSISFIVFVCLIFTNQDSTAEQTIINIPSSEVLSTDTIIIKESNRLNPFGDQVTTTVTPSLIFGVGNGIELATGVGTSIDDKSTVKGNYSIKKVFFISNSGRLTIGGSINPYFSEHITPDSSLYAHVSQRIKRTRTSLTAGTYVHGSKRMPNEFGVLLGLEQIIIPNKLRLAMDWISGDDSYGKMGVGLKYKPIPSLSLTSAVIIPNDYEDNAGFNISLSKMISLEDYKINKKEDVQCPTKKNL